MSFYSNLPSGHNDTSSASSLYPTIFEIISSQEIDSLLPVSVRYLLVNYWISRHPSKISLNVNNYFHEWFDLLIKGSIEWYQISRYNSTFVDKFYGLQRFNASNKVLVQAQAKSSVKYWPRGLALTSTQKGVVFFAKVLLPYIKHKLDELQSKYAAQNAFSNNGTRSVIIEKLYPLIKKIFYVLNLLTKLLFLSGRIGSTSFLEFLFRIEYTRTMLPLESSVRKTSGILPNDRLPRQNIYSLWHKVRIGLKMVNHVLSYSGSQLFPAFIFMLRVYQWWTTQDLTSKLQRKLNDVDKVIPRANNSSEQAYRSSEICPICHKAIQNPGVLESGYAACYPCAIAYLPENEGRCPVTKKRLLGCKYNAELGRWQVISGVRKLLVA